ncbi:uncharacterized protein [Paramisgurnus dabryanus]|uniref:uncharacterized protein n=1 Tax=Paramisgurnus dabryanus TaxID=90735 RepID=UPI003CCFDD58
MEVPRLKKRPRRFCEHCNTELCHTQYFDHRKRFFKNGVWEKKSKRATSDNVLSQLLSSHEPAVSDVPSMCKDPEDNFTGVREIGGSEMHSEDPEKELIEEFEETHPANISSDNDETADDQSIHLFLDSSDSESMQDDEDISCCVDDFVDAEGEILAEEPSEAYPHIQDGEEHGSDQSRSEKPEHLLMKLFAMMLLSWQSTFKISDNAITSLLLCIKHFMWIIGNVLCANTLTAFSSNIPKTLCSLRKWTGILRDDFLQYVVCPKCMTVYMLTETYELRRDGTKVCRTCGHIPFYNHPQQRSALRKKCGSALLRKATYSSGEEYVHPIRSYCYKSVVQSLGGLVKRPGFEEKLEEWRKWEMPKGVLGDVYDGQVWQDYQYVNGEPFLTEPNNLALMLNVDWFQPFKYAPYSVGAIYLVILNLPREDRFKEENMILVGLIPGPKEPSLNINAFLDPLVDELQELWHGVILEDNSFLGHQVYRAALLCLSSDIPATRKCGGFVGHGAYRGCHKCLKTFSKKEFGEKMDYSGFERFSWEPRMSKDHIYYAGLSKRAKTKAEQKIIEREYGARWSELFRLSYYDAIRFVVIDPMHNLLLGTARHVFRLWTELGILTTKSLDEVQARVESIKVPYEVGRIPLRISSGFTGFTADQWKNWTTIYSLFCLKGLINNRHYEMWFDFVQACIILCSRVISINRLEVADRYLQTFLSKFVELFGPLHCTPNMHLHLHLKECMLDYGPVYSFWCFSFERFNGILGKFNNNNRAIEVQIMRQFLQGQQLRMPWTCEYGAEFGSILGKQMVGTLSCNDTADMLYVKHSVLVSAERLLFENCTVVPLTPFHQTILDEPDRHAILTMYHQMYPCVTDVDRFAMTCKRVTCLNVTYSIDGSRAERSAYVYAKWCGNTNSFEEPIIDPLAELRPAIIKQFIVVNVVSKVVIGNDMQSN